MRTQRVIGSIVGACLVASLIVLAALILRFGFLRGIGLGVAIAVVVTATYVVVVGPWQRRWGTTDSELHRPMPGDDLLPPRAATTTRAITIEGKPDDVFPWLLQIGYGRGGWYSYDWIDNDGRPSVERIVPELQQLAVGDRIEMLPSFGPIVQRIEPNHYIVSGGDTDSWCLLVEPSGEGWTRLISRWRQDWPKNPGTYAWIAISDPGAFLMERRMLRRIRDLARTQPARRTEGAPR